MTSLTDMAKKRFKNTRSKSKSKNMAKRKSKSRRKSSSSSGSGKILGIKVPVVGKVFGNPTVKKALMGAGAVSLAISIATILNNPTINKALNNKLVRVGLATAAGDVAGGLVQVVKESPQVLGRTGNGGQQTATLLSQAGNGVA